MKLSYNSNFSKGFLLFNEPIKVYFEQTTEPIIVNIPTVREMIQDNNVNLFIELIKNEDYWKTNGRFVAATRKQMLCGIIQLLDMKNISLVFHKVFPNIDIEKSSMQVNKIEITDEQFDLLFDMLLVGCNFLTFEDFEKKGKEDENEEDKMLQDFLRKQKEAEEKLKKMRKNKADQIEFDKMAICIVSYFPQYKLQDLLELNYYTYFKLYEWSIRREYQFVTDVAAGNGLIGDKKSYKPLF